MNQTSALACNFSTSAPRVDLPILREGQVPENFSIPTREEFATEQEADTELNQLRKWIESKQCPSADELAALSGKMKSLAQLFDQISILGVLVIRRNRRPRARANNRTEQSGWAHNSVISWRTWWCSASTEGNLGENYQLLLREVHPTQPNPEGGPQVDGDWRPRRLCGYGHSRPHGFPPANPALQPLYLKAHRLLYALRSSSTIGHYITVYGTSRRILTDLNRNFDLEQLAKFCSLFRISKIRTSAYHPQSNGICGSFNQTLKIVC